MSNIGQNIKNRRIKLGLTADQLADRLQKSRATIYRYESTDADNMPIGILEPLAKALSTTPAELMGWGDGSVKVTTRMTFDDNSPMHALTQAYLRRPSLVQDEIIRRLEGLDATFSHNVSKLLQASGDINGFMQGTGLPFATVGEFMQGKTVLTTPAEAERIATYFHTNVVDLFFNDNSSAYTKPMITTEDIAVPIAHLNPETNVTNPEKYNAYMITVDINNSTHIFITKKKLFNTYNKKNFIYTLLSKGDYKEISDKFIRLIMHFDAFILDNKCYIITLAGRRLFQLEDISLKESIKTKNLILEKHLIKESDICIIDKYLSTPRHYSSLANPDYEIINELSNINKRNKKRLEQKYQLPIIEENGNWYIDISSNEKLKDFLDTINHKRALNFNNEIVHCKSPFTLDS